MTLSVNHRLVQTEYVFIDHLCILTYLFRGYISEMALQWQREIRRSQEPIDQITA
jgi:hypothetical protein